MATNRFGARAVLMIGASALAISPAWAQTATSDTTAPSSTPPAAQAGTDQPGGGTEDLQEIVVTGQTTRNRPLITASADITYATAADIDRKAPRSTADLLELVPGIFVEGTAGQLSNNYSVRGLQGGGQRFIQLEEDGMPIIYQGGGADFFFSNDLTIDRLEAVKGGSSGVLTVNGAGATINFISRSPNFNRMEGIVRGTVTSYEQVRGDFYLSAPLVADKLAFNVGGYVESSPGVRKNPFAYKGFRVKGALEYKFESGGFVRLSGKYGDIETAYYATQPYRYDNGKPRSIPSLGTQFGNVGGDSFRSIQVPVSTFVEPDGFREFRYQDGVKVKTWQARLDIQKPLTDSIDLFVRSRYLDLSYDFNGLFPGSGTGNAGLASAVNYLTPGVSPIAGLLTAGQTAFPTAVRFGIRNTRTGQVIGSNQTDLLNGLNNNGFLQQTTLNHDKLTGYDWGTNAGLRWEYKGDGFTNSLTVGGMYYKVKRNQNQSATAAALNDVRTNSDIYDVVALNAGNGVVGSLTDNGLLSYGNWGAGIRQRRDRSVSAYINDELSLFDDRLHIDGGIRWESDRATAFDGGTAATPQAVQPSVGGVVRNVGSTFDGTFSPANPTRTGPDGKITQKKTSWTVGANFLITPNLSVYGRYAKGFQTNNIDPITSIVLYEAGVRYQLGRLINASATVFRTNFDNQFYNFQDPLNPVVQTTYLADLRTKGVEVDVVVRPVDWFSLDFFGVFQKPQLKNLTLGGVAQPTYAGNLPERTPKRLYTVSGTAKLPDGLGEVFARYKYVGKIFADAGNGVALPSYGVTSAGFNVNVSDALQAGFTVDNIFNVVGLTEGNPRQGQTQAITDGYFYARGIVGTTYTASMTLKF